jgi:hypothetical protein
MKKTKELNLQPTERGFYAFNEERAGDFLIYIESQKDCYKFLYVPGPQEFFLSLNDFTESIKRGVLTLVEQLPEDIYNESISLSCPSR